MYQASASDAHIEFDTPDGLGNRDISLISLFLQSDGYPANCVYCDKSRTHVLSFRRNPRRRICGARGFGSVCRSLVPGPLCDAALHASEVRHSVHREEFAFWALPLQHLTFRDPVSLRTSARFWRKLLPLLIVLEVLFGRVTYQHTLCTPISPPVPYPGQ